MEVLLLQRGAGTNSLNFASSCKRGNQHCWLCSMALPGCSSSGHYLNAVFGTCTYQWDDLRYTDLRGFLQEPFKAAGIFQQGDGDGNLPGLRLMVCGLKDGYRTTLPVVVGYHAGEQVSLSIGELQLFAVLHAKHLHDVLAGIFISITCSAPAAISSL